MAESKNILERLVDAVTSDKEKTATKKTTAKESVKKIKTEPKNVVKEDFAPDDAMGKLLAQSDMKVPEIGDVLPGTILEILPNAVLLDLGPIGTGIVLGRETKDGLSRGGKLKKGDPVTATLTDLENDDGYIELSIREASHGKAWDDLVVKKDTKEVATTKILDANKGGLIVEVNGISGFLPVSQLSSKNYPRVEDGDKNKILDLLKKLVGQELRVCVLDLDQATEKLIVSEKAASSDQERAVIKDLSVGDVIEGVVSGVVDFGAFVKFLPPSNKEGEDGDRLEGLVHISELAWQLIDDPREIIKVGDSVEAKIISIDDTRISLSTKALKKDPWTEVDKKYVVGNIYPGTVDKMNHFGAFVYLDKNIHGLAHVSEFQQAYPGKKLEAMITVGKSNKWKILSIEAKEHRMGLLLIDEKNPPKEFPIEKAAKAEKKTSASVITATVANASSDAKSFEDKKAIADEPADVKTNVGKPAATSTVTKVMVHKNALVSKKAVKTKKVVKEKKPVKSKRVVKGKKTVAGKEKVKA